MYYKDIPVGQRILIEVEGDYFDRYYIPAKVINVNEQYIEMLIINNNSFIRRLTKNVVIIEDKLIALLDLK